MSAASPLIGMPSQQPQQHHFRNNDPHHHHHHHQRQPLPSASRRPTAAAMRREKMAAGLATGNNRGAGGLIRLEIYMDLLCPWCFIEKHSLESLMQRYTEEHPDVRFEATWKPYYIAPTMAKRMSLLFSFSSFYLFSVFSFLLHACDCFGAFACLTPTHKHAHTCPLCQASLIKKPIHHTALTNHTHHDLIKHPKPTPHSHHHNHMQCTHACICISFMQTLPPNRKYNKQKD
jgi:hypothetical protein